MEQSISQNPIIAEHDPIIFHIECTGPEGYAREGYDIVATGGINYILSAWSLNTTDEGIDVVAMEETKAITEGAKAISGSCCKSSHTINLVFLNHSHMKTQAQPMALVVLKNHRISNGTRVSIFINGAPKHYTLRDGKLYKLKPQKEPESAPEPPPEVELIADGLHLRHAVEMTLTGSNTYFASFSSYHNGEKIEDRTKRVLLVVKNPPSKLRTKHFAKFVDNPSWIKRQFIGWCATMIHNIRCEQ